MEFKSLMKLESLSILEWSTEKTQILWNHDLLWSSYQMKKICAHDLILEEPSNEERALVESIKRWWLWEFPCIALPRLLTFVFCYGFWVSFRLRVHLIVKWKRLRNQRRSVGMRNLSLNCSSYIINFCVLLRILSEFYAQSSTYCQMEKRSGFKKRSVGTRNISLNWFSSYSSRHLVFC